MTDDKDNQIADQIPTEPMPTASAMGVLPRSDFDEIGYLHLYRDVAAAVKAGKIESGYQHYIKHGLREGRLLPVPLENQNTLITIVVGMHRSGTSLCAAILNQLGIDMCDDINVTSANAKGHWERIEITGLHDRILRMLGRDWYDAHRFLGLPREWWKRDDVRAIRDEITQWIWQKRRSVQNFGFKDPRTGRLLPMWNEILLSLKLEPKYIFCVRAPMQVARSIAAENNIDLHDAEYRWMLYNCAAILDIGDQPICIVPYEDWFGNEKENVARIRSHLNLCSAANNPVLDETLHHTIDPKLRHDDESLYSDNDSPARKLYSLIVSCVSQGYFSRDVILAATAFVEFEQFVQPLLTREIIGKTHEEQQFQPKSNANIEQVNSKLQFIDELTTNIHHYSGALKSALSALQSLDDTKGSDPKKDPPAKKPTDISEPLSRGTYENAIEAHLRLVEAQVHTLDAMAEQAQKSSPNSFAHIRLRVMRDILVSGLFDADYYLQSNLDLRHAGVDPLEHYVDFGDREGRQPNPVFSPDQYRHISMGNESQDMNSLQHYINVGEHNNARASVSFDAKSYLAANPPLIKFVDRPLFHFLTIGRPAKLNVRLIGNKGRRRAAADPIPRVGALLGVKNEFEIIELSIKHLRNIGVDHIMVCDISSDDGTAEALEKYKADDFEILTLLDSSMSDNIPPEESWGYLTRQMYQKASVDWVIFQDADEFWIPASGNIKECEMLDSYDVLSVERFNLAIEADNPKWADNLMPIHYNNLQFFTDNIDDLWEYMKNDDKNSWIKGNIESKIMARPKRISGLTDGCHDVIEAGEPLRRANANDMLIAHLPFSTRSRFYKKVEDISRGFKAEGTDLFSGADTWKNNVIAWQWRRWAAMAVQGKLDDEFERNIFNAQQIEQLRSQGAIKSAAQLLAQGNLGMPKK